MAFRENTFEGGTAGAAITDANSGGTSGTPFDAVVGNGTAVYSTEQALQGTKSAKFTVPAGATKALYYVESDATSTAFRFYLRVPAMPTAAVHLAAVYNTGGAGVFSLYLNPSGTLRVDDRVTLKYTTPTALKTNTWYGVDVVVTRGTSSTNGAVRLSVYEGASTSALHSYFTSSADTGTTGFNNSQIGVPGTGGALTFYVDNTAHNTGSTQLIGPAAVSGNAPPLSFAGADQTVEPWSTVTLSGASSDNDGNVVSVSWAQTGGPTVALAGSGATRTFTAPATVAGATLTFTLTVTDNAGATASDSISVVVLPVTERAVIGGIEVPLRIQDV